MGAHLIDGEFQSDKYPSTPRGKVPLSVNDKTAQDLLWTYAQRHRSVDAEFSDDLETALRAAGFKPKTDGCRCVDPSNTVGVWFGPCDDGLNHQVGICPVANRAMSNAKWPCGKPRFPRDADDEHSEEE